MAGISVGGLGSGLDVNSLVSQLVAAERAPADKRLLNTDARLTAELTAVSKLKGALSSFQSALSGLKTASAFDSRLATVGNQDHLAVSVTGAAAPGTYDVEIEQLATAARIGSQNFAGGPDSVVGTGTLKITVGGKTVSVEIEAGKDSLASIRDAINGAPGNNVVRASLIRDSDGTGSYLVLTSMETGAANAITVSAENADAGLADFVAALNDPDPDRDVVAQDAIVHVSGYEIRSAKNTIEGAIDGVTLTLKKAEEGKLVPVTISRDDAGVLAKAQAFVSAYNSLAQQVKSLSSYDAATRSAGPLLGDSMLRNIETQLRRLVTDPVAGAAQPYTTLASLGITLTVGGTLELDTAKFNAAQAADPSVASRLFAGENGVATRLGKFLDERLSGTGEFAARDASLAARRKDLEKQQEALDARMQVIEARYLKQFTALDTLLSQLQSTSTALANQLQSLSNLSRGRD